MQDVKWLRIEDENGYIVEILHTDWGDKNPKFIMANLALMKLWKQVGEDINENWILTIDDFYKIVNKARAIKPYDGKRLVNEDDPMYKAGFHAPELIY